MFQLEIGLGLAAFALLCLYDFIKTRGSKPWKTAAAPLFFAAVFLLLFATVRLVDFKRIFSAGQFLRQGLFFLSVSAFAGMFFALFFALPFSKTYIDRSAEKPRVVSTGLYALCRHPGVLFFVLGYLLLWLSAGGLSLFFAFLAWSAADIVHVFLQDRFFFPRAIAGYGQYQRETPFLLPDGKSLRAFMQGGRPPEKEGP